MNWWKIEQGDLLWIVRIEIILAQGEWSIAKEAKTILKRCNKRQRQTFFDMGNVYVFYIASIWIHGKELLRQSAFHQKYRRLHNETNVRHIWEIDIRTIRRDLWNKCNQLGRLFMEVFIFGWWWTSHESLAHRSYSQILYCAKERWTRNPNQSMHGNTGWRGWKVHQDTELWTQLMVSQWSSSGRFSQDSPPCSLSLKSKSSCHKWAHNQQISLDGFSACRCSTTSHGNLKTMNRNVN